MFLSQRSIWFKSVPRSFTMRVHVGCISHISRRVVEQALGLPSTPLLHIYCRPCDSISNRERNVMNRHRWANSLREWHPRIFSSVCSAVLWNSTLIVSTAPCHAGVSKCHNSIFLSPTWPTWELRTDHSSVCATVHWWYSQTNGRNLHKHERNAH